MDDYESLSHTKWDCKYHVVFIPKYRRKVLYVDLRRYLGDARRRAGSRKDTSWRIMSTCSSRSRRNTLCRR